MGISICENEILFGFDKTPNIVSIDVKNSTAHIFVRENDTIISYEDEFRPYLLVSKTDILKDFGGDVEIVEFSGTEFYKYLVITANERQYKNLIEYLKKETGKNSASTDSPFFYISDLVSQYMLYKGKTLFKGMKFSDIYRMQVDIETYTGKGFQFSSPFRESDAIILISISDNRGWETIISGKELTEGEMLQRLVDIIKEKDPDVIEGHNIHKFDLWYIEQRAKRHKIKLSLGRDQSLLKSHPSRLTIAERQITYPKYEIFGRHIIDTWIMAQLYDVSVRSLEGYGLKAIARFLGVAPQNRTYVEHTEISSLYDNDCEKLVKYAMDDVRETNAISEILSYPYFIQSQIFPYSFQNVTVRGNATRINSLFLREYIRNKKSIPKPPVGREFAGGYADIFTHGVIKNILHCDVQSLYPSIMLSFLYFPEKDTLGVFGCLLKDLKAFRLNAKDMMKKANTINEKNYYNALQTTFKILINSFYGYLGFSMGNFSDFSMAEKVTAKGREIIKFIVNWLNENNCIVAEIDTDGVYFRPPAEINSKLLEEDFVKRLSTELPEGINLELDERYKAMFSYKIKNYALLDYNDNLIIKGSALKSRGVEKFVRDFLKEFIRLLLAGKKDEILVLKNSFVNSIKLHQFPVSYLAKTEILKDSIPVYMEKVGNKERNHSAVYELAIKSDINYRPGDQLSYYITGTGKKVTAFENCKLVSEWDPKAPDENIEYYLGKLAELYKKFEKFL